MKNENKKSVLAKHYFIAFWITLVISISLIVGGFLMPPKGEIDGSVMTSVGELFLWPALAFGAKALEDGKTAKLQIGNHSISVSDNNEDEKD